jgi:hypothetical protein
MGEISEGIKMQIHQHGGQYDLNYGYEVPGKTTIYHSALNTGFGISYVLSVVVAILSARPGALLLIENPEAHIHLPTGSDFYAAPCFLLPPEIFIFYYTSYTTYLNLSATIT